MHLTNRARTMRVATLILALAVARPAVAGPFEDGMTAFNRQDYVTALRLWRPVAEQANVDAQHNLGVMYANGQGVPMDDALALKWYRLAAEQGKASAQSNLGIMYADGMGIPQNIMLAYMWSNLGAAGGSKHAGKNRDLYASRMTPAQIAEAQRLSREWRSK